ncbi:hypothetical protein OG555_34000 [Kribbella sp. NBC_01484]|uniref:hypothetical protein n=1 Tax=Kribbella sp. NBC_01484 TaxID=2903579 RepID=UPI002E3162D9|nr:hypothetical protein [Kribbella sp. NBC_01484]
MTSEVFKSIASAKGVAFVLVAWGLPVAIGMAAWWAVALPAWQDHVLPDVFLQRLNASGLSNAWLFLVIWLLLTLSLGLNATFFFRLYEGYHLPARVKNRRKRTHWLHRENLRLSERLAVAERRAAAAGTSQDAASLARLTKLRADAPAAQALARKRVLPVRRLLTQRPVGGLKNWRDYPSEEAELMPSALGNRIRAFERYGNARFGLDILILWYEFVGAAEDQVREQIEAARQGVEVFLAGSVVFALFAFASLVPLVNPDTWRTDGLPLVAAGLAGIVASVLTCRRAVAQTGDWGAAVTALVNTNRGKVAAAFGFVLPQSLEQERKLWRMLNGFVRTGSKEWEPLFDRFERLPGKASDFSTAAVGANGVPPPKSRLRAFRALLASSVIRRLLHR